MNVNLSIFSNHHTIIDGCTAPVSDAGQFIVEFAGILFYHYIVFYQDPSGNERALSLIPSHCYENKRPGGGENLTSNTITKISSRITYRTSRLLIDLYHETSLFQKFCSRQKDRECEYHIFEN